MLAAAVAALLLALTVVHPASTRAIEPLPLAGGDYSGSLPADVGVDYHGDNQLGDSIDYLPALPNNDLDYNKVQQTADGGSKKQNSRIDAQWGQQFSDYEGSKASKPNKDRPSSAYNHAKQQSKSKWMNGLETAFANADSKGAVSGDVYANSGYAKTDLDTAGYAKTDLDTAGYANNGYANKGFRGSKSGKSSSTGRSDYEGDAHIISGYDKTDLSTADYANNDFTNNVYANKGHANKGYRGSKGNKHSKSSSTGRSDFLGDANAISGYDKTDLASAVYANNDFTNNVYANKGHANKGYRGSKGNKHSKSSSRGRSDFLGDANAISGYDKTDLSSADYAKNAFTDNVYAKNAFTDNVYAKNAFTDNVYAKNAFTDNVYAKNAFTDNVYANNAFTDNVYANKGYNRGSKSSKRSSVSSDYEGEIGYSNQRAQKAIATVQREAKKQLAFDYNPLPAVAKAMPAGKGKLGGYDPSIGNNYNLAGDAANYLDNEYGADDSEGGYDNGAQGYEPQQMGLGLIKNHKVQRKQQPQKLMYKMNSLYSYEGNNVDY